MSFLHGVKSNETTTPGGSIREIPTAVIFLVGISPVGPTQTLIKCSNEKDDAQFGDATPANDIATSLQIIRKVAASTNNKGGACPVIVVNVFDSASHTDDLVSTDTETFADRKVSFKKHLYGTIVLKKQSDDTTIDASKYTIDSWGNVKDITTAGELDGLEVYITGKYVIPAAAADIVGTVDGDGIRTGMKMHALCYSLFGYTPKIIITPKYSTLSAVFAEGRAVADYNRARWLHDNESGDTVSDAISNRSSGTIGWNTSHKRTDLLYPYLKVFNTFEGANITWPYSAFMAGAYVKNDSDPERGYWNSPSNIEMNGVDGVETDITTSWTDGTAENQQLNAVGVITYLSGFGIGTKTWGNRSAVYPSISGLTTFINVQRVDDILAERIELAWLKWNDKTVQPWMITAMLKEGNNEISKLIQKGAMLPGSKLTYDEAKNPTSSLQDGKITFTRSWLTGPPAELIQIDSELNLDLFKFLNNAS